MSPPDPRVQARTIGVHACNVAPDQLKAWEALRGALAGALHGQPADLALAFSDAVLACIAAPGLTAGQRAALARPLLDGLAGDLLGDAELPPALPAPRRGLQALPVDQEAAR